MSQLDFIYQWEAPEFRYYEKNFGWFLALGVVVLVFCGYLFISGDYFSSLCVFLMGVMFGYLSSRRPYTVNIGLTSRSVHIDQLTIPYKQIKNFWIVDNHNHKTLNLHTNQILQPIVYIELADQNTEELRDFLSQYIEEHQDEEETILQVLANRFKI